MFYLFRTGGCGEILDIILDHDLMTKFKCLKMFLFLKVAVGLWGVLGPVGGTVGVLGCWLLDVEWT